MITYSNHADEKMDLLDITADEVEQCIHEGKVIESYEDAYPFPAALYYHRFHERYIHVVVGFNNKLDIQHVITVYYPDTERWDEEFFKEKVT